MAINYETIANTARRLITENGRTIELVRLATQTELSSMPWGQNASGGETYTEVPAIQVLPNAVRVFGLSALGDAGKLDQMFSVVELVYVIFAEELDLKSFTKVRDGNSIYQIEATQSLKPADTTLLGFIGVRK
jgi:hypothetical protein